MVLMEGEVANSEGICWRKAYKTFEEAKAEMDEWEADGPPNRLFIEEIEVPD